MANKPIKAVKIKNPVARFFVLGAASGLGLGYAPKAPGTFGSLLGIPLGLWLIQFPTWSSLIFCFLFLLAAVKISERAGLHWGNSDSGRIVIDEVLGQALSLIGAKAFFVQYLPQPSSEDLLGKIFENVSIANFVDLANSISQHPSCLLYVALAFGLFRLFDISKPTPARSFDNMPSGWGVMMDDVVAGLYAALAMRILSKMVL